MKNMHTRHHYNVLFLFFFKNKLKITIGMSKHNHKDKIDISHISFIKRPKINKKSKQHREMATKALIQPQIRVSHLSPPLPNSIEMMIRNNNIINSPRNFNKISRFERTIFASSQQQQSNVEISHSTSSQIKIQLYDALQGNIIFHSLLSLVGGGASQSQEIYQKKKNSRK